MTLHPLVRCSSIIALAALPWAGCDSSAGKPAAQKSSPAPVAQTPLVPKTQLVDWCKEHGVPESVCTRCNERLIPEFKRKGDWCAEHNLPESQCTTCKPELEAKFKAMAPKS